MTKVTGEMLERVESLIPIYENAADWTGREYPALAPSDHHKTAAALRSVAACACRVIEPGEEEIERYARALCAANGFDPEYLEPGDDPYGDNNSVIDGSNSKDEPCHFFWRRYDRRARAVLAAISEG